MTEDVGVWLGDEEPKEGEHAAGVVDVGLFG